jgi:hypothetical protein
VELWHFFVSDEQAALLQQSASQQQQLLKQDELLDRVLPKLARLAATVIQEELHGITVEHPARKKA